MVHKKVPSTVACHLDVGPLGVTYHDSYSVYEPCNKCVARFEFDWPTGVPEIERYVWNFLLNHNPKSRILLKKVSSKMGCLLFECGSFEGSHTILVT